MSDNLSAMLAQYETNSNVSTGPKKETDLTNYFTTFLKDGINQATKTVRILPPKKEGTSPFVEVWVHTIQVDGQWRKFTCPKHEKEEACPFCEARELLLSTGSDADKELAKKYAARKMYVVKLIDREHEEDGPKFWRFSHDYRKTGILDKIQGILQAGVGDFTKADTGMDLKIQIARDQNKRPVVQSIVHTVSSPLSTDEALAAQWLADETTWSDVYSIKGYDYLEIIVKGGVPQYDREAKKYVDKLSIKESGDSSDNETSFGKAAPLTVPKTETFSSNEEVEDLEDDLPF